MLLCRPSGACCASSTPCMRSRQHRQRRLCSRVVQAAAKTGYDKVPHGDEAQPFQPGSNGKLQIKEADSHLLQQAEQPHAAVHKRAQPASWLPPVQAARLHVQQHLGAAGKLAEAAVAFIMPRERGDTRDWVLMGASILAFVYMSMGLCRIYMMLYYSAGWRSMAEILAAR